MRLILALLSVLLTVPSTSAKGVPHTPKLDTPNSVRPDDELNKVVPKTEFDKHTKKHVAEMLKLFKSGDIEGALGEANKAIEVSPKSAPLYLNRAAMRNFLSQKKKDGITNDARLKLKKEALADLYKAKELGLMPKVAGSQIGLQHLSLAAFLRRSGAPDSEIQEHLKKAHKILQEAYAAKPAFKKLDDQILISMMNSLMLQKEYQKIIDMCSDTERVQSMSPGFRKIAFFAKATAFKKLGKDSEAEAALAEAKKTGLKLPTYEKALKDDPLSATEKDVGNLEKEFAPLIEKARAGLPDVKTRFVNGLKSGERLFLTVKLHDDKGQFEQVFIRVLSWNDDKLTGVLSNVVRILPNYSRGDKIDFNEKEVVDWTIVRPDGSEEGNLIGKYIDSKRERETGKKPELLNKESSDDSSDSESDEDSGEVEE